ncbi:hypothetical protein [Variovorax saccharolyticus]|uniref:hypothetical protein n=1 Tax=Variovorax saccharolyticus TaxID=3053516 RepID=UPI00257571F7|nr:hypothetical protein [Variovorax sp. J22R187]MDM0019694.1 hypothetical protein [Variovorax sp. J22R187]
MKRLGLTSKVATLALAGLATLTPAAAQRNDAAFESDRRFCASGRSGMDFNSCMWQMQNQRNSGWNRNSNNGWGNNNGWDNNNGWNNGNNGWNDNGWNNNNGWQNQQPGWRAPPSSMPRLSDMQQRALDNCVLLQRSEQARCRATVLSTVR